MLDVTLQERSPEKVEEEAVKERYNWFYENSINNGKVRIDLSKPQEYKYNQWRTNNSLSKFQDTVHQANMMNCRYHVTDQMHYDFLFYQVRKKNRYGKKKTPEDKRLEKLAEKELELIRLIQETYKYNITRAKEVLAILSDEQISIIRKRIDKGGVK